MAFTSPLTINIGSTPYILKRVNQDNYGSVFQHVSAGVEVFLTIRHQYESAKVNGQMSRHNVELRLVKYDAEGKATEYIAYAVVRYVRGRDPVLAGEVLGAMSTLVTAQAAGIIDWEN